MELYSNSLWGCGHHNWLSRLYRHIGNNSGYHLVCWYLLEYSRLIKPMAESTAKVQFPYIVYKYVHMFYRFATGLGATLQ